MWFCESEHQDFGFKSRSLLHTYIERSLRVPLWLVLNMWLQKSVPLWCTVNNMDKVTSKSLKPLQFITSQTEQGQARLKLVFCLSSLLLLVSNAAGCTSYMLTNLQRVSSTVKAKGARKAVLEATDEEQNKTFTIEVFNVLKTTSHNQNKNRKLLRGLNACFSSLSY